MRGQQLLQGLFSGLLLLQRQGGLPCRLHALLCLCIGLLLQLPGDLLQLQKRTPPAIRQLRNSLS